MTTLIKIGFFASLPVDKAIQHLNRLRSKLPDTNEDCAIAYLQAGCAFLISAGIVEDLLDPQRPIVGAERVLTDGTWAWTSDLAYYVEKYHIRLPQEFVRHMAQNGWMCPQVNNPKELVLGDSYYS